MLYVVKSPMAATVIRVHEITVSVTLCVISYLRNNMLNTLACTNLYLTAVIVDNDQRRPSIGATSRLNFEQWCCAGQGEVYCLRLLK